MSQLLRAHRLLTEQGWLDDHQLRIESGAVAAIEPIPAGVTARDAELLCPAYIDTHVHGGAGVDVMDDVPDALDTLAMHKAREGVGAFLPTTVTAPLEIIHAALMRIARHSHSGGPGAQILGSYLEGPYFTPQNKGAHPPELFRELDIAELDALIAVSDNTLRVVALAPEKPGALQAIRHLKRRGIRVMLGHSAATYQQTLAAFDAGADGLVHLLQRHDGAAPQRARHSRRRAYGPTGVAGADCRRPPRPSGGDALMLLLRAGSRGADYRCHAGGRYAGRTVHALW